MSFWICVGCFFGGGVFGILAAALCVAAWDGRRGAPHIPADSIPPMPPVKPPRLEDREVWIRELEEEVARLVEALANALAAVGRGDV